MEEANEQEAIRFCLENVAGHARSMNMSDSRKFLRGFLLIMEGRPEADVIHAIHTNLAIVDTQLGDIASGQMPLPLDPEAPSAK